MKRAVVAVLVAVTLASCVDADPSPPTPADLGKIDVSPDHTITVDEDGFDPTSLDIDGGEVILLVNDGDEPHSFTADDQRFNTGQMLPGDETTLVLVEPGSTTYFDETEPDHEGTIKVTKGQ
jgi:plastocyanin